MNIHVHFYDYNTWPSNVDWFKCPVKECGGSCSREKQLVAHLRDDHGYSEEQAKKIAKESKVSGK